MPTSDESDKIAGVWIVEPSIHGDQRGLFIETYRREWFPNGREMVQGNRANRQAGRARRAALPPAPGRLLVRAVRHRPRRAARPARGRADRRRDAERSTCPATTTSACSSRPGSPTASPRSPTWSSPTWSTATTTRPTSSAWRGTIPPSAPTGASPIRSCPHATRANPLRADLPAGRRPYWPMRT